MADFERVACLGVLPINLQHCYQPELFVILICDIVAHGGAEGTRDCARSAPARRGGAGTPKQHPTRR